MTNSIFVNLLSAAVLLTIPVCLFAQRKSQVANKNKEMIKQAFENWRSGTGSFFDLLADDVTWTIPGRSPIARTYNSRRQFLQDAIEPLNQRLSEKIIPTVKALYAEGDMVVALWDGHAVAKDGIAYDNTYSWYMRIKNGRIINVVAFFDSIELAELWKRVPF